MAREKAPQPTVGVDTREKIPLVFTPMKSERHYWNFGDYGLVECPDHVRFEWKTPTDWLGTLSRSHDRFIREVHRARNAGVGLVVVVGAPRIEILEYHCVRQRIHPNCVAGIERSLMSYGVHVRYHAGRAAAVAWMSDLFKAAWKHHLNERCPCYDPAREPLEEDDPFGLAEAG